MATYQTAVDKLLKIALAEEGYREKRSNSQLDSKTANAGSANYTKYARDLDNISGFYNGKKNGYPWCDVFVDWCMVQAFGVEQAKKIINHGVYGAGCDWSAKYYRNAGRFYTSPQKGDQIFFGTKGNETHTGLVYAVDSNRVYTIEGNTSTAAGVVANGGGVCKKSYPLGYAQIVGYGRPNYAAVKTGWQQDQYGWWYVHEDGSYTKNGFEQIDGYWYFFNEYGYMVADMEVEYEGKIYKFDSDGHCTAEEVKEVRYNKLKDITSEHYRPTIDKLIKKGVLHGKGGEGDEMIVDLSEDSVRLLVILDRAGVFGN